MTTEIKELIAELHEMVAKGIITIERSEAAIEAAIKVLEKS